MDLALDIRLTGLALGMERVEALLKSFFTALAGIDGTTEFASIAGFRTVARRSRSSGSVHRSTTSLFVQAEEGWS